MNTVDVISTKISDLNRRVVKFLRMGKSDIQETPVIAPFGIDSNPIKNMKAMYANTGVNGQNVIIGYINENVDVLNEGEVRVFSADDNGMKIFIYVKNDGTIEFGGNTGNLTRFQELEQAFDELKLDFNNLVLSFNSHMHPTAGTGPPSPPTPGPGIPAQSSTADISPAKIDELKTL